MTIFSPIWRKAFTIHDAMKPLFQFKQSRRPLGFLNPLLTLACLALSPIASAVNPPPDGGYPGFNTAEGTRALFSLTTGSANTAVGWFSLFSNVEGSFNTAVGAGTLLFNVGGQSAGDGLAGGADNTAVGAAALLFNTTGSDNTAVGAGALVNNDADFNTGVGAFALNSNTTGDFNSAFGWNALVSNTEGSANTAMGASALSANTTAENNTAIGTAALQFHTTGNGNTAIGASALVNDTSGQVNTATGASALFNNDTGSFNTANGLSALFSNTTGGDNTADGAQALSSNIDGNDNTAVGLNALLNNTSGDNNTALGRSAGGQQTTGSNNVYIGANIAGVAGESNACYIGSIFGQTAPNGGTAVFIDASHKLGTLTSSRRFKEDIKPMDKASERLFALEPVAFRYKKEIDPAGTSQLGLVAEDVEKVNPDLVVRDKEGKPYSVRYDQVNAMLLNEFLKEHRKVEEQEATIAQLKKEMETVVACLKEQDSKIQRASAQIEVSKAVGQAALSNR
jgi:trimeric autotransporter adhesin